MKLEMSGDTLQENEAAENAFAEENNFDSATMNVEHPRSEAQFESEVEKTVDEPKNDNYEETNNVDEFQKVNRVDDGDHETAILAKRDRYSLAYRSSAEDTAILPKTDGGYLAYQSSDEDDDDLWEDDEFIEDDDNDTDIDEDEVSEGETTGEEGDEENSERDSEKTPVDEDQVNEEEEVEEDNEDEANDEEGVEEDDEEEEEANPKAEKEIANGDKLKAHEHSPEKVEVKKVRKSRARTEKMKVKQESPKKLASGDKPKSSLKKKGKKKVESMGMIFMCSSKTKNDCFHYRVLGLPQSKKDLVEKIYPGMRLFLYDVDLKLMYGIYKAKGSGGYNIEPKAFKSQFPSQVRFTILDDCLPIAEEKFKNVIKENYFTKKKFDCQLNSEQVKRLCKLFVSTSKGHTPIKSRRSRKAEKQPLVRRDGSRKRRKDDNRRPALREEIRYLEHRRKRPRTVISPAAPLYQPLLPTVPSLASERNLDVDAYRRDLYLESRDSYRSMRDPILIRHDPYASRRDRPTEHGVQYRERRDPYLDRHDSYRDGRDLYRDSRDLYRDGRDSFLDRRDPYIDERDPYLERRDSYADRRDVYPERRVGYKDGLDPYLDNRGPYKDVAQPDAYSPYRRDSISDRRDVYREDPGVVYRDSYRLEDVSNRQPLSLESRRRYDIVSQDPYVSYRTVPSTAKPLYSVDYPSRSGLGREYRL